MENPDVPIYHLWFREGVSESEAQSAKQTAAEAVSL